MCAGNGLFLSGEWFHDLMLQSYFEGARKKLMLVSNKYEIQFIWSFNARRDLSSASFEHFCVMKMLYIHGLGSSPKPEKMDLMKVHGEVVALHLDYITCTNAFQVLSETIQKEHITAIVGSSMGGLLGFWLAEQHALPCLLFNPAISKEYTNYPLGIQQRELGDCPKRLVVLGQRDEVVDPQVTFHYLTKNTPSSTEQRLLWCSALEHQIADDFFGEMIKDWLLFLGH
jgi:predicted esterase YcpF (UPF0227 family)